MNTMIRSTLGLAAAFFISVAVQAAELGAGALSIGKTEGDVTYRVANSEEFLPAPAGTALPQGAVIKTGPNSTASVVFSSGSVAIVEENSVVEVAKFLQEPFVGTMTAGAEPSVSETQLNVQSGGVVSVVAKLRKGSSYTVSSPVGAAGVRGTSFFYNYDPATGGGELSVTEGSVVLNVGGQQVTVGAGFTYNFATGAVTQISPVRLRILQSMIARFGPIDGGNTGIYTPESESGPTIPATDLIGVSIN
jgi:hypothetical protein